MCFTVGEKAEQSQKPNEPCYLPSAIDYGTTRPNKYEIRCVNGNGQPQCSLWVATFNRALDGIVARVFGDK
jgi:hypothetical protein